MVDEVTGYQYERAEDALRLKLNLFLAEEMRKWEPTFPEQLWVEFGRLTRWKGPVHSRPKYWGNLVMELIYGYLDPDVAKWLKENAPRPFRGQNYHQWLNSQYGLKRLVEHIWMVIGMGAACQDMAELSTALAVYRHFSRNISRIRISYREGKTQTAPMETRKLPKQC